MTLGVYYVIRHKATGEIMPQAQRNRGYSHWNPSKNNQFNQALDVPRLLSSRRKAHNCIRAWSANPNARQSSYQTYYGEWNDDLVIKDDGRKIEDLEVVKLILIEVKHL
jgi:hypothetical protein